MEQIPDIIMQCPKCERRFPFGDTYCEECSAMLEPVEAGPAQQSEGAGGLQDSGKQTPAVTDEKIEDSRIDRLRADIENKFVYALLAETGQLKGRLARKEKLLAALRSREGGSDHVEVAASAGRIEAEIDEIVKKVTKLEITLDTLEQKLQDEIAALVEERVKIGKPAATAFFSERTRYFRMVSSELRTKVLLLDVIRGKRSPSALRIRSLIRPAVVIPSGASVAVILALSLYIFLHQGTPVPAVPVPQAAPQTETGKETAISKQEVSTLLNDIRRANLTKDAGLWRSRYSAAYLASKAKEENITSQWEKLDFTSLQYRMDKFESGPDRARATITWYIEFKPRRGNHVKLITQRLRADFAREDGRLKITSVSKQGS